jgi:hypothetical protein
VRWRRRRQSSRCAAGGGGMGFCGSSSSPHLGNTKPCVVASAPCALAVGDAEQADILQKPRRPGGSPGSWGYIYKFSGQLKVSFAWAGLNPSIGHSTGSPYESRGLVMRPEGVARSSWPSRDTASSQSSRPCCRQAARDWPVQGSRGRSPVSGKRSENGIIQEPAHDKQAGHNANPVAENVDARHPIHPFPRPFFILLVLTKEYTSFLRKGIVANG